MPRILVTGADSFTGKHLTAILADAGYHVHGLVRDGSGTLVDPRITTHDADLLSQSRLNELMREIEPEKIIHLAAISFVAHDDADEIYSVNLLGTRHVLEAIRQQNVAPSAVLLASSANIYGNAHSGVIDEGARAEPVNDYAVSKLAMEYMAATYRARLPIIISRPFNYTGVGQSANFLIPKIVDHLKRRAPSIELGNIDVERDWSDVRMVAQAYARLILSPTAIGRTLNICSGRATNLRDVLALACRLAGHDMEIRINPAFVRANEVRSLRGSTEALTSVIGELPDYSMEDTLRWMLAAA